MTAWFRRSTTSASSAPTATISRAPSPTEPPADDAAAIGRMLDAVGALVQLVGVYAHDTDARHAGDVRSAADRWRRHLTTGLGHPNAPDDEDAAPARGGGLAARDWEGAVRFASGERRTEHAHVTRTLDELRETVWTMVHGLHAVVGEEAAVGRAATDTVRRLETTIAAASPDEVRGAALAAVGEIAAALAQRERERAQQIAELGREVSSLGAALEDARREGATDALTGLGNRRAFDGAFAHAAMLHQLWGAPVCLLMIDLDLLKQINDQAGHAAGDAALQDAAHRLNRTFLGRTDVVTRIGGDEFAVLLRDVSPEEGMRLADRLLSAFAEPDSPAGVSIGVATMRAGDSAEEWLARADAALYTAKEAGRGRAALAA